jgi:hypothetical protein
MTKKARSLAAKKGWKTRRARARAAEVARKQKARARSAAAKKGWETRRLTRKEQARLHMLADPDPDYLEDLWEEWGEDLDLDLSDMYDLYYGYEPGEKTG